MTKEEVVLQITLKLLDNFKYDAKTYGATPKLEQAEMNSQIAAKLFNSVYESIKL